jgi:hypothetical protein
MSYKVSGFGRALTDPIAINDLPLIQGFSPFFDGTQIQTFSIADRDFPGFGAGISP